VIEFEGANAPSNSDRIRRRISAFEFSAGPGFAGARNPIQAAKRALHASRLPAQPCVVEPLNKAAGNSPNYPRGRVITRPEFEGALAPSNSIAPIHSRSILV